MLSILVTKSLLKLLFYIILINLDFLYLVEPLFLILSYHISYLRLIQPLEHIGSNLRIPGLTLKAGFKDHVEFIIFSFTFNKYHT